ncbi:MAG: RNA methyltransferase [Ruminiclostridium sp.]|nr:RNA methyltransferase [Ruminiclostridium sp.]
MNISSRKNHQVTHFRSLVRERSYRRECGEFPVEGARLCLEALNCGLEITSFMVTEAAKEKYPEIVSAISEEFEPDIINEDISAYISDTKSPQGVFIAAKMLDKPIEMGKIEKGGKYIILDGLQDTGNIGTVIRTCDALGIDGVILSPDCADIYSPKIVRSAMGSLFRLPVIITELTEVIALLKKSGFNVYAAVLDESAVTISEASLDGKTAVVIGNEGNGVSEAVIKAAENKLYIPIRGAESLNAAVAASIISWEMTRRQ